MNNKLERQIKSATAVVTFTGLGMISANEGIDTRLEALFVHAKQHNLEIYIYQSSIESESAEDVLNSMPDNNPERTKDILKSFTKEDFVIQNKFQLHSQVSVAVRGNIDENSKFRGVRKYRTEPFNRSNPGTDKNDFQWLINLNRDGLLGDGSEFPRSGERGSCCTNYARSVMTIENCLLFTSKLARTKDDLGDLEFHKVIDPGDVSSVSKEQLDQTEYGRIADTMGVAVYGKTVDIEISYDKNMFKCSLPQDENPYLIEIRNVAENMESDMEVYREFWNIDKQVKYNLMSTDEIMRLSGNAEGGESVGTRKTCASAEVEVPSVSVFFPDGVMEVS
jgi:hypothetical protein